MNEQINDIAFRELIKHVQFGRIVCPATCTCGRREDPAYNSYPRPEDRYAQLSKMGDSQERSFCQ